MHSKKPNAKNYWPISEMMSFGNIVRLQNPVELSSARKKQTIYLLAAMIRCGSVKTAFGS